MCNIPAKEPQGQAAAPDVARRRPHRRDLRTTPDGRDGWLNMFIRKGWDVYNSDAVERGRSGFAGPRLEERAELLTKANPFERFRIGQGPGSWNADPPR